MKILLGLSGGLDSLSAARQLMDAGHEVEGATLLMHARTDLSAAQTAANELRIPLHILDGRTAFEQTVIADFISEYTQGRTPNPCTVCNRYVKMELLYRYASENGFDQYATGHYAYIDRLPNGRYAPRMADDRRKDQSYMLWRMTQPQLSMLSTPLAGQYKTDLRQSAALAGYSAAKSKESQDICFLSPGERYIDYIEQRAGASVPGNYIDKNGNRLGPHRGLLHYTVGQRKGLGISMGRHVFITRMNPADHTVTLCDEADTYADSLTVKQLNFVGLAPAAAGTTGNWTVKIRYAAPPVPVTVEFMGKSARVRFEKPVRTPAPGQSAVFYENDRIAFGGIIDQVHFLYEK